MTMNNACGSLNFPKTVDYYIFIAIFRLDKKYTVIILLILSRTERKKENEIQEIFFDFIVLDASQVFLRPAQSSGHLELYSVWFW